MPFIKGTAICDLDILDGLIEIVHSDWLAVVRL